MLGMVGVTSLWEYLAPLLWTLCLYSPVLALPTSVKGALWKSDDSLSPAGVSSPSITHVKGNCASRCHGHTGCKGFCYNDVSKMCLEVTSESALVQSGSGVSGFLYYRKCICAVTPSTDLIDLISSFCYVLHDTPRQWEDARDHCPVTGGQLAVLDTRVKADFVWDYLMAMGLVYPIPYLGYHLGASRPVDKWNTAYPASGQDFVWLNGQPLNKTVAGMQFAYGSPNNVDNLENFIGIYDHTNKLRWSDQNNNPAGYICQYSIL